MNAIFDWIQSNWYETGMLMAQGAILATLIWYARKALRAMRASQRQVETLLSLSLTPGAPAIARTEPTNGSEHGTIHPLRSAIGWLQAPVGSGGFHPMRRVVRWLQAPVS